MLDEFPTVTVVLLSLLVAYLLNCRKSRKTALNAASSLVMPPRIPIIGHLNLALPNKILDELPKLVRKYGGFLELFLITSRLLIITDIIAAKEILMKRPKQFRRMRKAEYPANIMGLGRSLFNSNSDTWSRIRRFTAPAFSKMNIMSNVPLIWSLTSRWVQQLQQHTDSDTVLNFSMEATNHALNIITKIAFSSERSEGLSEWANYFNSPQFITDVQSILSFALQWNMFPIPIPMLWRAIPSYYQYECQGREAVGRFETATKALLHHRKQQIKENPSIALNSNSLLDLMLRRQSSAEVEEDEAELELDIIHNIKIFYIAGAETTGITISWAAFVFASCPVVLAKVRSEADKLFAKFPLSESDKKVPTAADIETYLKDTDATVKEILRMYPAAAFIMLQTEAEKTSTKLSNGLEILPNDMIFIFVDEIHRNKEIFSNPDQFYPERWLVSDKETLLRMEEHFVAFGSGPRICPGMYLAYLEATLAIAALAHSFDFKLGCDPQEIHRELRITTMPNKMPVMLKARKQS